MKLDLENIKDHVYGVKYDGNYYQAIPTRTQNYMSIAYFNKKYYCEVVTEILEYGFYNGIYNNKTKDDSYKKLIISNPPNQKFSPSNKKSFVHEKEINIYSKRFNAKIATIPTLGKIFYRHYEKFYPLLPFFLPNYTCLGNITMQGPFKERVSLYWGSRFDINTVTLPATLKHWQENKNEYD